MRYLLACALAVVALAAHPACADVLITVDKSTQQMSVVVDGAQRWQWRVSTGAAGYETPSGTFRMDPNHFSKEFDDAPMPHSIFFTRLGHAIHGYLDTRRLGLPVSHGCVRLDPENAARLYALVEQEGVLNTTVVVSGHAPSAVARPRVPTVRPDEVIAEPAVPPPYRQPYGSTYSRSTEERYAPPTVYRRPDAAPGYSPPAPPPAYPPYPRPAFPFADWR
jgi:hypothetical protein